MTIQPPYEPLSLTYDWTNRAGVVVLKDGDWANKDRIIGMFKLIDPECYSIVVMSGAWLLTGYYLSPMGWMTLDPPRYSGLS